MASRSSDPQRASHPPILIAGPSGVGKSAVAMALARQVDGEIISVDSMQVYRELDIGTAKPSVAERAQVPHHLIDVADMAEPFDAAQFAAQARRVALSIQRHARVPILCGGTGLYFRAYLDGVGEAPAANPCLRAELGKAPLARLLDELERNDPVTWSRIDRKNPRRVIRAVEVIRLTGRPFSTQKSPWTQRQAPVRTGSFFGLTRDEADLRARIDARVDAMFARGLVPETERLLKRGPAINETAMQAIGYRQVAQYLRGERTLEETVSLIKLRTRQFAKRQMTWFRNQFDLEWVELQPEESPDETARRLLDL